MLKVFEIADIVKRFMPLIHYLKSLDDDNKRKFWVRWFVRRLRVELGDDCLIEFKGAIEEQLKKKSVERTFTNV